MNTIMNIYDFIRKQRQIYKSKTFFLSRKLTFKGYYISTEDIPNSHGVYAAFVKDRAGNLRLLYIGRAFKTNNLKKRIQEHIDNDHNSEKWKKCYDPMMETIVYSYAEIDDDDIIPDIEKALVFKNKPKINSQDVLNNNIKVFLVRLSCVGHKGCLRSSVVLMKDL